MIEQYANKELRNILKAKSLLCYGKCGKYKKVMERRGLTIQQIEDVMDQMIKILRGDNNSERKEIRPEETKHELDTKQGGNGSSKGDDVR